MNITRLGYSLSFLAITAFVLCTFLPADSSRAQQAAGPELSGIALMPFWLGKQSPELAGKKKKLIDCTLAELCYLEGDPLENAARTLDEIVGNELQKRFQEDLIPLAGAKQTYSTMDKEDTDTLRSLAVRFGKKLEVENVMAGTVWRFEERKGGALAAASPASVGFALFLINVRDGKILWSGTFDKTQTALSENLLAAPLYFKQGLKWLTAGELATVGVDNLLQQLPLKSMTP